METVVNVEKQKQQDRDRFFLRRNSRQKNQNGAGTPPPFLTTLTTQDKKAYAGSA